MEKAGIASTHVPGRYAWRTPCEAAGRRTKGGFASVRWMGKLEPVGSRLLRGWWLLLALVDEDIHVVLQDCLYGL